MEGRKPRDGKLCGRGRVLVVCVCVRVFFFFLVLCAAVRGLCGLARELDVQNEDRLTCGRLLPFACSGA